MTTSFNVDAARALGGPDWLVGAPGRGRGTRRRSRVADAGRGDLALQPHRRARPRAVPTVHRGGARPARRRARAGRWPMGGRGRRALGDDRRARRPRRPPRDRPGLEAKGVRVCGIATCDATTSRDLLGAASEPSEDAFTVLHDAFLAGGAFIQVPSGVVVEDPILVLHWCEGDSGRRSRTRSCHSASTPRRRCSTGSARPRPTISSTRSPSCSSATTRTSGTCRCRSTARAPGTSACSAPCSVGDATLRTSAVALGGDYARLRSESAARAARRPRATSSRFTSATATQMLDFRTLQDHDAPRTRSDLLFKGAVEDTARSVYSGLVRLRPTAQKANAFQTNRNLVLTEGASAESIPNLEIEANDVKCSHASTVGPIDDDQLYYLESRGIRRRGSGASDRARLLRRRVRAPAGRRAVERAATLGGRQAGAPASADG